jgi:hypothetical protein
MSLSARKEQSRLGFCADVVVASAVSLEIKLVAALLPAHDAQIVTYLLCA